jgi:hypothetical protein
VVVVEAHEIDGVLEVRQAGGRADLAERQVVCGGHAGEADRVEQRLELADRRRDQVLAERGPVEVQAEAVVRGLLALFALLVGRVEAGWEGTMSSRLP